MTVAEYLRTGIVCGLSSREVLSLPVGVVFDLVSLHNAGVTKRGD